MTRYPYPRSFYDALPGLIQAGATLEDLYKEMLTVEDLREVDASPEEVRRIASVTAYLPSFLPIRLGELFGGLTVEHTDDYVLALVSGLGARAAPGLRAFLLRTDRDLREEVFWQVFEIEGGGEVSLTNVDRFTSQGDSWQKTVLTLTADGTLDRARVLRSCLEALNRDFSSFRAGWFSRLYAALAPTPAEAAVDQDLLLLTLASSITASASLAVKMLAALHTAGLLDADAFVASCGPVVSGAKGAATAVLRVLSALAADASCDPGALAEAIALAMANAHPDVQRAAVAALARLDREDLVRRERDLLAPAVAAQLSPGLTSTASCVGGAGAVALAPAVPGLTWREAEPTRAWTDADALERYAFLLEDPSDAVELELALAWLATARSPGDVLASLVRRVRAPGERDMTYAPVPELLLAAVSADHDFMAHKDLTSAGEPLTTHRPEAAAEVESRIPSFITRLREVAAILQGRVPSRPLLATPTDSHGWVGSDAFAERLRQTQRAGLRPLDADLVQAVLRLAPDQRPGVLAAFGLPEPLITTTVNIGWHAIESSQTKPNGTPLCVWWNPEIIAHPGASRWLEHPALIPSSLPTPHFYYLASSLETAETALVHPASTAALIAGGISLLLAATLEATPVGEEAVLDALSWHPGAWTPETVQLVALGMAAVRPEVRSRAVEILVGVVPSRISASDAARGFAACAPACLLTRWSGSFSDAASLSGGAVVDLLTALLPRLDRRARGIGSLLTVLLDESIRLGRVTSDPTLVAWLKEFSGTSSAARAARALSRS